MQFLYATIKSPFSFLFYSVSDMGNKTWKHVILELEQGFITGATCHRVISNMMRCFLVMDNRWTHSSSDFTMAVLQGQLRGFALLSKDLQSCGSCCSADWALCLFTVLFLEGAPVTQPFTSTGHKWPCWTPHCIFRNQHRLWSTAKMPGTKGKWSETKKNWFV